MTRLIKFLALMLMFTIIVFVNVGCVKVQNNTNNDVNSSDVSKNELEKEERVEISMVVYDRGGIDYEDNQTTRWINENGPADVKWIPIPRHPYAEKLNILLASGDIPDVVQTYDVTYAQRLVDQEMFRTIGDLVDTYGENIKKYVDEDIINDFAYYKGEYYFLIAPRPTVEQSGIYVRKDWLNNLGLEMPNTIDDFYNVAKAFTQDDPDGNGEDDTFGYDFSYTGLNNLATMFNCVYTSQGLKMIEGEAKSAIFTDNFIDMLTFANRLAMEGIVDKEYVTDTQGTGGRMKFYQGRLGMLPTLWHDKDLVTIIDNNPDAKFEGLRAVEYQGERFGFYEESPVATVALLSKEAKNPEAVIRWFDWLVSDAYYTLYYGIEGKHYKETEDGKIEKIDEDTQTWFGGYSFDFSYCRIGTPDFEEGLPDKYKYVGKVQNEYHKVLQKDDYNRDAYWPNLEAISRYEADINKLFEEYINKIIVGGISVDEGVEFIREEYMKRGGDKVLEEYTKWYKENVRK